MVTAADLLDRWRADLESWAIPEEILAGARRVALGAAAPALCPQGRAEARDAPSGPSFERAWEALDAFQARCSTSAPVAGAACLPLAPRATKITAVDSDPELLGVLAGYAGGLDIDLETVCGRWPDVAGEVGPADVVTCHHVLYNVADIAPFVAELTAHARRLVVAEMTARHPLTSLNPLWERFHGIVRPTAPTAEDLVELLEALGLAPAYEVWSPAAELEYESFEDLVEVTTRRLCLDPSRAGEVAAALREDGGGTDRLGELEVVTPRPVHDLVGRAAPEPRRWTG